MTIVVPIPRSTGNDSVHILENVEHCGGEPK